MLASCAEETVETSYAERPAEPTAVAGKADGDATRHAKFMVIDETTVATGSNNWSSTGTSFNEENTLVMTGDTGDSLIEALRCSCQRVRRP
jgi:phosphatidylserine/phosphatidylglycerophosphate/cardiolipin synthase-like enzyme